jgi:hypothetical protein
VNGLIVLGAFVRQRSFKMVLEYEDHDAEANCPYLGPAQYAQTPKEGSKEESEKQAKNDHGEVTL